MLEFRRPDCVDDDEWAAVTAIRSRMDRATRDDDAELMLGTAKDLCESVAKITLRQLGQKVTATPAMPELINQAHRLIDRIPNEGGAAGGSVRGLAQCAMKLAKDLNELRNQAGTGHGRPNPTPIDVVDGRFAVGVGDLWSRWVLSRLDALVANDPARLVGAINGHVFYAGDLAARLAGVGLANLTEDEQRALGFAVGQRGGPRNTVNVYREGIAPAASSSSLSEWPAAYRGGLALGMTSDWNGPFVISASHVPTICSVLRPLPDHGASDVQRMIDALEESGLAFWISASAISETVEALRAAVGSSRPPVEGTLVQLAEHLQGRATA